jgi:hypothetical protein
MRAAAASARQRCGLRRACLCASPLKRPRCVAGVAAWRAACSVRPRGLPTLDGAAARASQHNACCHCGRSGRDRRGVPRRLLQPRSGAAKPHRRPRRRADGRARDDWAAELRQVWCALLAVSLGGPKLTQHPLCSAAEATRGGRAEASAAHRHRLSRRRCVLRPRAREQRRLMLASAAVAQTT